MFYQIALVLKANIAFSDQCNLCCRVTIHFRFADGSKKTAKAAVGENLLDAALSNNLDIDGYGM